MLPNSFDIHHKVIYIKYLELQKPGFSDIVVSVVIAN